MVAAIIDFVRTRVEFVKEHGDKLSEKLEFSFNTHVDLCVVGQETEVLGSQETPEEGGFIQKRPIVIKKIFTSVYLQPSTDIQDTKTMSKPFYDSLASCTDEDQDTKICSTDEWKSDDKPFSISEESLSKQETFTTFKRLRITLKKNALVP